MQVLGRNIHPYCSSQQLVLSGLIIGQHVMTPSCSVPLLSSTWRRIRWNEASIQHVVTRADTLHTWQEQPYEKSFVCLWYVASKANWKGKTFTPLRSLTVSGKSAAQLMATSGCCNTCVHQILVQECCHCQLVVRRYLSAKMDDPRRTQLAC